ncbi:MAG: Uma2 family endonuclease [Streptomyces sp.]
MTPTAHRPQMLVEEFEELARTAPDTVTLEFINGKLEVKPVPDGDHDEIIMWVQERCMQQRPDLRLYRERGLRVESYRNGRARPDGALAPPRHFTGHGEWSDAAGVLMVVEVASHDTDTDQRDRLEECVGYAGAAIPVYLLIDRDDCSLTVHSDPCDGKYGSTTTRRYGTTVELPSPVGMALETDALKDFVR